jgi:hypothetical protein
MHTLTDTRLALVRVLAAYHAEGERRIDLLCAVWERLETEAGRDITVAEFLYVAERLNERQLARAKPRRKAAAQTSLF